MKAGDPLALFSSWLAEAEQQELNEPLAMSVATVDADGRPSLRMVLLRGFDERGFVFYTNLESRKAHALQVNPVAALCFHWKALTRQVRVEGRVEEVSAAEADEYFATRPRDSQIGAWASKQSQALTSRFELEGRVAKYVARFGLAKIPRPPFWSGYRVLPDRIEFWEQRPYRLHERTLFIRADGIWQTSKLFP